MKRTELKRTRMKRRPRKRKPGDDPAYLAAVRTLRCCNCDAAPESHPHHEILNGRGKSQKAPDNRTMPMCFTCHENFHRLLGMFEGWNKAKRREWQAQQIAETQAAVQLYAAACNLF